MNKTPLLVTLFVETGDEEIRTRVFRVAPNKRVPVGRASLRRLHDERPAPAKDNAFFDCPVVSRRHAFLSVDTGALILTDNNSRHGCFVNLQKLYPNESRELFCGDVVNIGGVGATLSRSYSSLQFTVSYSKMANELERIDSGISIASSPNSLNQSTTFVVPDSSDESGHSDHGVTEPDENDLAAVDAPSSTLSSKIPPRLAARLRAAAEKVALRRKLRNYGIDHRSERSQLAPHVISLIDEEDYEFDQFDPEFEPDEEEVDEYEDFETALNAASATAVLSNYDDGKDIDQPNQHPSSPPDVPSTTRSLGTLEPPISLNVSHSDSKAPSSDFQPGKSTNKDANPSSSAHSNAAVSIASPTADPEHIREIASDSLVVNSILDPPMTYSQTLLNSNHLASSPHIHSLAYLPPPPIPGPVYHHSGFGGSAVAGSIRKGSETMKINTLLNDISGTDSAARRKRKVDESEVPAFVSCQEETIDNDATDDSTKICLSATASTPSHNESQATTGQGAELNDPTSANILSDGHFQASDELTGDSGEQSSMTTQEASSSRHAKFQDAKATADTNEPRVKRVRRSCSPTPSSPQSSVPAITNTRRRAKRSKSKTSMIAPFVMGTVVGGLGLFGALAMLPESFF